MFLQKGVNIATQAKGEGTTTPPKKKKTVLENDEADGAQKQAKDTTPKAAAAKKKTTKKRKVQQNDAVETVGSKKRETREIGRLFASEKTESGWTDQVSRKQSARERV